MLECVECGLPMLNTWSLQSAIRLRKQSVYGSSGCSQNEVCTRLLWVQSVHGRSGCSLSMEALIAVCLRVKFVYGCSGRSPEDLTASVQSTEAPSQLADRSIVAIDVES